MNENALVQKILDTIKHYYKTKERLSREALFFLESGFGICGPSEIKKVLKDQDSDEREMFLEYFLFPGQRLRLAIEPALGVKGVSSQTEAMISQTLLQNRWTLTLFHPQSTDLIQVHVPSGLVTTFIARLFLTRSLDSGICEALDKNLPNADCLLTRVLIRTHNYKFENEKKELLVKFTQNWNNRSINFSELVALFLKILDQAPENKNISLYFIEIWEKEKAGLKQILEFHKKLERYTMEYLMLSKYPIPSESYEVVLKRLENLNTIVWDILEIPFKTEPEVVDLGKIHPGKDMDKLFRIFS